ncbi:receptor expression-enhancing protein 2 isoform X4 [Apis mellifera]|uniref:Receptor expression-enhancing protein 2 isoform X4 n=1 Tax=Apis mellifera TaxID=7460 RepID=A0A7M7L4A5_APIME|nr:receptor expression-enhancing protein 2 isoform X4 [Apis mellifera]|eukprot:XP_026297379.1 receptor expression-enhancing protein 2 isoform X4 [Apis mellifera]
MEMKREEPRPDEIEENPFLWIVCKTGAPRLIITSFHAVARYCADQMPKKMSLGFLRTLAALLVIVMPRSLTYVLLYPIFRLVFGNLYPAYASYKAVRTKNVKEYVKWMMYWIVFALFTCAETFTDVFFSFWFPFYYEIKTILVIWLLSPATKGSSILYRRFVHPALIQREAEIDEALARATEQGYTAVLHLGSKGVNYATTVLMQTAIKGGGGLVQHLKKSYSLSDLTGEKEDENRNTPHMHDETDMEVEPRRREHVGRRGYSPRRTQSSSNRVEMYFSEVDVDVRQPRSREPTTSLTNIRSSDDISSGYSSGEALQSSRTSQGDSLVRTSSVGARTRAKPRSATKKTPEDSGEDSDSIDPPSSKNLSFPPPLNLVTPEQALEILLLLSRNRNVADYINFDRGPALPDNKLRYSPSQQEDK